ncbi:MAG TPA: ornithine cyclodeaminase family protein [Candidatus Dormibacteraeota bacterium]|nr:ornithine cyclodeaminase family protein [Candidatus Dormibacteraeota bacterium]
MGDSETVVLTADDVARIVSEVGLDRFMDRMIETLGAALASPVAADSLIPRRGIPLRGTPPGVIEWMPHLQADVVTMKLVSYSPGNHRRAGAPTILGTISLYDRTTGHLEVLADAGLLTSVRTGAVSAIATSLLADPGCRCAGLVGAGAQAVTQLHALSRVLDLEAAIVYDVDRTAAESLAERAHFVDLDVRVASHPCEIEAQCDVICTATSSPPGAPPVLDGCSLRPGAHLNAVGSDQAGKTELPLAILRDAVVCPDFLDQAISEGECQQLQTADIGPDLMQLCADPERARQLRQRLTVFDSTGFALEDHVALSLVRGFAEELGVGTRMRLEHWPKDHRNPYELNGPTERRRRACAAL